MAAVRLSDVAAEAGVSLATASRVLNGSDRVPGKAVSERVHQAAQRLGYVTNAQAQALARSRSGLIGLVVHDIADPYFATIARRIQQRAFASGEQVLLTQTDRDPETELRAIRSLVSQRVDALMLVGTHRYGDEQDAAIRALLSGFEEQGGKVVGLGQGLGVGRTVVTDSSASSHELATALVVEGFTRFALPESIREVPSATHRLAAFRAALTEAGIEPEFSAPAGPDRAGGHAFARLLAEHVGVADGGERRERDARGVQADGSDAGETGDGGEGATAASTAAGVRRPLCVFAPTDVMALGTMAELRRLGIDVPGEVAVAGFGGTPEAADANPSLTTVALPLERMADLALAWVLERPGGRGGGGTEVAAGARVAGDASGAAGPEDGPSGDETLVRGEVLMRESTRITPVG